MMNANAKIRFEFEDGAAFVFIGGINFAVIFFREKERKFMVKFVEDFADFRFPPEEAAESIAAIFGLDTEVAAQIAAAISGIQRCQCGQHLASPAHICPPRYHILGDNGTCTCCRQCEAHCRTYPQ